MNKHIAAVVQLTSVADVAKNLARARELVGAAADRGASVVLLPENFAFMGPEADRVALAEPVPDGGPILAVLRELATNRRIHLIAGGFPERSDDPARTYNACLFVDPRGQIVGHYRKIHLFDVAIPDGARYEESRTVLPGREPVVATTELGTIGLSVCYDLRFPELYRELVRRGAEILVVPSAFTAYTGKDHWHPLLTARAIENQCFVLAAAQVGRHDSKRVTYGHSIILDPWGRALAEVADGDAIALAELDPAALERARRELPALQHRRL
ncbi:MAG: carbon-nitrogen hydrolase family protein [Deltaproteobacteria bacterium]|nr:carbon-nitrogen hydrolase family protein [Deltaproteobacteria bacterium]